MKIKISNTRESDMYIIMELSPKVLELAMQDESIPPDKDVKMVLAESFASEFMPDEATIEFLD